MILSICDNADILSTMRIIKIIIQIIKIVVPIMLIISLMVTYTKATASGDNDLIAKANKQVVPKIVAALAIFLVPTFVGIIANLSANSLEYMKCIANASESGIDDAYYEEAKVLLAKARSTLLMTDYTNAKVAVYKVKNTSKRNELIKELNEIAKLINEKNKTEGTGGGGGDSGGGGGSYTTPTDTNTTGVPINLSSSFNVYAGSGAIPKYGFYVPKNPTTNMPLIVFMPANEYSMNVLINIFKNTKLELPKAFMFIPTLNWSGNWNKDLENMIKDISSKYYINTKRISITGFSTGGWYMYYFTSSHQDMIAAIFPISVGHTYNSQTIQQNLNFYRTIPMKGYGESIGKYKPNGTQCGGYPAGWIAANQMSNLFNGLGRGSDFTNVGPICHDKIYEYVFNLDNNHDNKIDILEWAISQSK